jgi:hypothetical protein
MIGRFLCLTLLCCIVLTTPVPVEAADKTTPSPRRQRPELQFQKILYSDKVWDKFQILNIRYEAGPNRIVWDLKAKKTTAFPPSRAAVSDFEALVEATFKVEVSPMQSEYQPGDTLVVWCKLGSYKFADIPLLIIQPRK